MPTPGDVVRVGRAASVQFRRPLTFRVIRVIEEWLTYQGWVWLHGYALDRRGNAVAKRDLFVRPAGLELLHRPESRPVRRTDQLPVAQPRRLVAPAPRRTAGR
ncbi:hypothetical protein ABT336_01560 [Micromonospora sp. NPDC000207]|uniref:hypothetical protein n=1 Tax=Micromonospora sp. NPDC000207 TaxID=3154246 RepID=UPI003330F378